MDRPQWMSIDDFLEEAERDVWADREAQRQIEGEQRLAQERESREIPQEGQSR